MHTVTSGAKPVTHVVFVRRFQGAGVPESCSLPQPHRTQGRNLRVLRSPARHGDRQQGVAVPTFTTSFVLGTCLRIVHRRSCGPRRRHGRSPAELSLRLPEVKWTPRHRRRETWIEEMKPFAPLPEVLSHGRGSNASGEEPHCARSTISCLPDQRFASMAKPNDSGDL